MSNIALIIAGGSGNRMNQDIPLSLMNLLNSLMRKKESLAKSVQFSIIVWSRSRTYGTILKTEFL